MAGELKVRGRFLSGALTLARLNALGAVGAAFTDTVFAVKASADATKKVRFDASGLTTATTRVVTWPDADITVAGINRAQSWSANQTLADVNLILGTTTGTKIGTATSQKLGFWNVTPVIQPAAAGQAAAAAQTQQTQTDSTGGSASTTLAAITAGAAYAQADMTAVKNGLASLAARLAEVKADMTAVKTLEDAMRTALVNSGVMKGAA